VSDDCSGPVVVMFHDAITPEFAGTLEQCQQYVARYRGTLYGRFLRIEEQ
jgi:hypothetical protein